MLIGVLAAVGTLDGIIDTVSAQHPMLPLFHLLKTDGKLILVGLPEKPLEIPAFALVKGKHHINGSWTGIEFSLHRDIKLES